VKPLTANQCGSCGLTDRPVVWGWCDLCRSFQNPEPIQTILARVLAFLNRQRRGIA